MMGKSTNRVESIILDIIYREGNFEIDNTILQHGLRILPILGKHLVTDLPIEPLERLERILKAILYKKFSSTISGENAREIALFQKTLGFLFKYKSYAIKASSPLGYSIFLQNEGEGFSFQQHLSHKTEVFRIFEVHPGGYVFICDYKDWFQYYDKESFSAWLAGQADNRYDRYRYKPKAGDVFVLDRFGIVHSVIGCILEEFATISTDMVDRLYDQNSGKSIPPYFNKNFANEWIRNISTPDTSRCVKIASNGQQLVEIYPLRIPGGEMTPLARMPEFTASSYLIEPMGRSEFQFDEQHAVSIYIYAGKGRMIIGEPDEVRRLTPPTIPICSGDLLMVPPSIYYGFLNEGNCPLKFSEHKILFNKLGFH